MLHCVQVRRLQRAHAIDKEELEELQRRLAQKDARMAVLQKETEDMHKRISRYSLSLIP